MSNLLIVQWKWLWIKHLGKRSFNQVQNKQEFLRLIIDGITSQEMQQAVRLISNVLFGTITWEWILKNKSLTIILNLLSIKMLKWNNTIKKISFVLNKEDFLDLRLNDVFSLKNHFFFSGQSNDLLFVLSSTKNTNEVKLWKLYLKKPKKSNEIKLIFVQKFDYKNVRNKISCRT